MLVDAVEVISAEIEEGDGALQHAEGGDRVASRYESLLRVPRHFCLPVLSWLAGPGHGSCCR